MRIEISVIAPLMAPDSMSGTRAPPPRYGTAVKFAPVAAIKRASVICVALPVPAMPMVTGCCFDNATSSGSVFAGTDSCTTTQCGCCSRARSE